MKARLILGNQLFDPAKYLKNTEPGTIIFMREDQELCTHFKYHKHKIIFFLAAMRKYALELKKAGYTVHYEKLDVKTEPSFDQSLIKFIQKNKIEQISFFEIEDKFFEIRILELCRSIQCQVIASPMFLTSRQQFKEYLGKSKKPFMKSFYEGQRKRLKIMLNPDGSPLGGQWSFDEDNRKALPKSYIEQKILQYEQDAIDRDVISLVDQKFSEHPGVSENVWLPTTRPEALDWLRQFLTERFEDFGPYEDALSENYDFVNHSVLTPFLNTGLLTPDEIIKAALQTGKTKKIPLNSLEGFIRQIVGWREFVRGIYQNYSEVQDSKNYWNHQRKLNATWYSANTGVPPLDHVIRKTTRLGYAHHIERLMVVGSLMLLLEVHPTEAHRWFMEMFIDSSDWVMGPNVYGMAIFSDGGIFATKPYFCGSNYYKKMGGYKTGEWQDAVDGLYWGFIEKHRGYFSKNPRLAMMARTVEKMDPARKQKIFSAAAELKNRITTG